MTIFVLYVVILPLLCFLAKSNVKYHKSLFFFLLLLAVFRYDTTSDYFNYTDAFYQVINGQDEIRFEPAFLLFSNVFSFTSWGFLFLFATYAIITYELIYLVFKRYDILFWGIVTFILLGYINLFDNVIRQGVSIAIFAYSAKYIVKKNFKIYFLFVLLGMCFHTSAIITLLYYPLFRFASNFSIPRFWSFFSVIVCFVLYKFGFFLMVGYTIISHSPYGNYIEILDLFQSETSAGLGVLARAILPCFSTLFFYKSEDSNIRMIINIGWMSSLASFILRDYWVLDRINEYLYVFELISLALLLKKIALKKEYKYSVIMLSFLFILHVKIVKAYYGYESVYYTIFSERCAKHVFYVRQNTLLNPADDFTDREGITYLYP